MVARHELPLERWSGLLSLIDRLSHSEDVNERLVCASCSCEWEREWNYM